VRVIVNQLAVFGPKTGIGHYTHQLLSCLRQQLGAQQISAFPNGLLGTTGGTWLHVRSLLKARSTGPSLRKAILSHLQHAGGKMLRRHFHSMCVNRSPQLYHEPNYLPLPTDVPTVVTLHDLSVLLHPEWHPAERVNRFEKQFPLALAQARHFLTVSKSMRREVIRILGIPGPRVTSVYNGIRANLHPLSKEETSRRLRALGLPSRFLLHVGAIEPRKNLLRLMQAYCSCPASFRDRWPLLLVGPWGWNAEPVANYLQEIGQHRGIRHIGYVRDEDLPVLYNGARALLYPSFYEGFGLPPMEMLACGGAVIASTADALVETVGAQAHLIDPEDVVGWREAMVRVATDGDWWESLRAGATAVARPYTWDRCAADTIQVYRSLCGTAVPSMTPMLRAA
jgi:glycosyltransferase involved in cell wall biosynthesis